MKRPIRSSLFIALMSISLYSAAANPNISIQYLKPLTQQEATIQQKIKESDINETLITLSNRYFSFNKTVTIQYGSTEGPLYDPNSYAIHIPYSFYQESLNYFSKNKYQERFNKSPQLGALDTLLHTLLHEAGHAYIADQNIPVLGKEEDAVDNFATILLLNYVDNDYLKDRKEFCEFQFESLTQNWDHYFKHSN